MDDEDLFEFFTNELGLKGDDTLFGYIACNIMNIKKIEETTLQNIKALFVALKYNL